MTDAIVIACDLERRLLDPAVRADRSALETLLHADFEEYGASGRVWSRDAIIDDLLGQTASPPIECEGMVGRVTADGVVLVTYRSRSGNRVTLRSSIWVLTDGRWQLLFHQGTIVPS